MSVACGSRLPVEAVASCRRSGCSRTHCCHALAPRHVDVTTASTDRTLRMQTLSLLCALLVADSREKESRMSNYDIT